MILHVTSAGDISLEEPDVFTAFAITGPVPASDEQIDALRRRGVYVAESNSHAFVEPQAVAALAQSGPVGPDWLEQFESMLAYAGSKGWVDDAGRVRAHWVTD